MNSHTSFICLCDTFDRQNELMKARNNKNNKRECFSLIGSSFMPGRNKKRNFWRNKEMYTLKARLIHQKRNTSSGIYDNQASRKYWDQKQQNDLQNGIIKIGILEKRTFFFIRDNWKDVMRIWEKLTNLR